jgi:hypothetical protein
VTFMEAGRGVCKRAGRRAKIFACLGHSARTVTLAMARGFRGGDADVALGRRS